MLELKDLIRTIPDFPKPGIEFRDLTTLFLHGEGFRRTISALAERYARENVDLVCGVESRGFILGAPLAVELGKGFVPIRKEGKLPGKTIGVEYTLEYGEDRLEVHADALPAGARVLMMDDLLATGGTMQAACKLVETVGARVLSCGFVVELVDLQGRAKLPNYDVYSLVTYTGE